MCCKSLVPRIYHLVIRFLRHVGMHDFSPQKWQIMNRKIMLSIKIILGLLHSLNDLFKFHNMTRHLQSRNQYTTNISGDRSQGDAIFALFEFWVIDLCFLFSVWYAHAYHAVICAMICVAEHDMRIRKWHVFLNISQVLLNISLLKSFLLMIYVFKWHNLTILDM